MQESISTDKLMVICDTIEKKILEDDTLKQRIKKLDIDWIVLNSTSRDYQFVPNLTIEFKD